MMSTTEKLLQHDKKMLEITKIPIVTVSGTFRHDIEKFYSLTEDLPHDEILFSRAHFSMALAVAMKAWKTHVDPSKAWLVDPTNYVDAKDWEKVKFTTEVGELIARNDILKSIKNFIDSKARNSLPITKSIHTPLLYLFENVHRPILSFHYEAGNILASIGKKVVQVVTDPHVRDQYLEYAHLPTMRYCVFDENTKVSFLEKASLFNKKVDPNRVIITGPSIDPRIVSLRTHKSLFDAQKRPLRLCIATGGLGTNKSEIEQCIRSLAPALRDPSSFPIQVIVYAGVHEDIRESIHDICMAEKIPTSSSKQSDSVMRILFSPHIVEANELLIKYAFPWADGFITKPSGDMAYDAAAAGCFLLTLNPWGEWEHNIRDVFEQLEISRRAYPTQLKEQLLGLSQPIGNHSWIYSAMKKTHSLPELFTQGTERILDQMSK